MPSAGSERTCAKNVIVRYCILVIRTRNFVCCYLFPKSFSPDFLQYIFSTFSIKMRNKKREIKTLNLFPGFPGSICLLPVLDNLSHIPGQFYKLTFLTMLFYSMMLEIPCEFTKSVYFHFFTIMYAMTCMISRNISPSMAFHGL